MKHTSGPWHYAGYYDHCEVGREYHGVTDSQGFEIINQNGIITTEQDAILIAAAPELLETLIEAIQSEGFSVSGPTDHRASEHGEPKWICRAREIIAKATK